jgi:hypothetical protein
MSANDLTTLANLKGWLPIDVGNTDDDDTLARLITATSQDFMRATHRPDLLLADYTEVHQGDGSTRLTAYHWPITDVITITIGGVAVLESSDRILPGYYIDADIDPERIWQVYLNGYSFSDGAAVEIEYSAGYVQPGGTATGGEIMLPGDIEQAIIEWCGYRYKGRPNTGTTQRRSTQGESTQVEQVDAPPGVIEVIQRYTRTFPSVDRRGDVRAERSQIAQSRMAARKR